MSALNTVTGIDDGGQEGVTHKGTIIVATGDQVLGDVAAIIAAGETQTEPTLSDQASYKDFFANPVNLGATVEYVDLDDEFPTVGPTSMTH